LRQEQGRFVPHGPGREGKSAGAFGVVGGLCPVVFGQGEGGEVECSLACPDAVGVLGKEAEQNRPCFRILSCLTVDHSKVVQAIVGKGGIHLERAGEKQTRPVQVLFLKEAVPEVENFSPFF
jgi:hypothetical protein